MSRSTRIGPAPLPGRPRRLVTCAPGHTGIVIGHEPSAVADARRWVMRATRTTPSHSQNVALAASELVTNAIQHTRSGDPGGRVQVELITRDEEYVLQVTDDGPRPGAEHLYPRQYHNGPEQDAGCGLRVVAAIGRWSWTMNVDGTVTVQALIPREGRR